MFRAMLVALLTATSFSASAQQWTEIGRNTVGDTFYIDLSSLKKDGSKRTYWTLTNFGSRNKEETASIRARELLDCNSETYQVLTMTGFSEHSAKGKVLGSASPTELMHVAPRTIAANIMQTVCSK